MRCTRRSDGSCPSADRGRPMPRWAADGVREGMNSLTAALDSLVRCSESGIPAPGGPAFLLEGALRQLASPLASFAAGLGDRARRHFLGRIASRALCLSTGYAPFPGYEGCPPYRSPLLGIRTLFSSRRRTSCRFSGQPALRDRSSRIPVHALIRDCGTSPVRTGAPPRNIASLCPSSHRTAGTAAAVCWTAATSLPSPPGLRCTVAGNVPKPFCRT